MRRTPYESAAAPMSHSAADPAEFNAVCRSKSNLPNRTDSNAALLPYLTHQLGSAHEWSGVWNGPKPLVDIFIISIFIIIFNFITKNIGSAGSGGSAGSAASAVYSSAD